MSGFELESRFRVELISSKFMSGFKLESGWFQPPRNLVVYELVSSLS